MAKRFATGLVTGNADDVASLSGTVAGDLFVFGDIRDVVREGKHLAMGEEADRLVLGLATVGPGGDGGDLCVGRRRGPVRAGLTLVKDARKVGRLGEGLTQWAGRSAREVVDAPMLQQAVATGSVLRPGETVSAIKAAFRAEKAGALVRLAKDVGRVGEKAGTRGALDTLRIAQGPKDVARAARLAEAKGGQTRAILKTARPRRAAAGGRRVQSDDVGVRRAAGAVRFPVVDQGDHRAGHHGVAAPQEGAAVATAGGGSTPAAGRRLWRALSRTARLADSIARSPILIPQKMELPMPSFHNGDVEIAYLDEGEGDPIILVHGFASSKNVNWVYPTWVSELKKDGRRVIALDNRGHGNSSKLYDSAQYEIAIMASDVIALMDHLAIERADIMGYSLGSRMTAVLARDQPQRLRSAILGGIGIGLIEGGGPGENVATALEAPSLEDVTDPVGRTFRAFADQTRSDRRALAACLRGSRRLMTRRRPPGSACRC